MNQLSSRQQMKRLLGGSSYSYTNMPSRQTTIRHDYSGRQIMRNVCSNRNEKSINSRRNIQKYNNNHNMTERIFYPSSNLLSIKTPQLSPSQISAYKSFNIIFSISTLQSTRLPVFNDLRVYLQIHKQKQYFPKQQQQQSFINKNNQNRQNIIQINTSLQCKRITLRYDLPQKRYYEKKVIRIVVQAKQPQCDSSNHHQEYEPYGYVQIDLTQVLNAQRQEYQTNKNNRVNQYRRANQHHTQKLRFFSYQLITNSISSRSMLNVRIQFQLLAASNRIHKTEHTVQMNINIISPSQTNKQTTTKYNNQQDNYMFSSNLINNHITKNNNNNIDNKNIAIQLRQDDNDNTVIMKGRCQRLKSRSKRNNNPYLQSQQQYKQFMMMKQSRQSKLSRQKTRSYIKLNHGDQNNSSNNSRYNNNEFIKYDHNERYANRQSKCYDDDDDGQQQHFSSDYKYYDRDEKDNSYLDNSDQQQASHNNSQFMNYDWGNVNNTIINHHYNQYKNNRKIEKQQVVDLYLKSNKSQYNHVQNMQINNIAQNFININNSISSKNSIQNEHLSIYNNQLNENMYYVVKPQQQNMNKQNNMNNSYNKLNKFSDIINKDNNFNKRMYQQRQRYLYLQNKILIDDQNRNIIQNKQFNSQLSQKHQKYHNNNLKLFISRTVMVQIDPIIQNVNSKKIFSNSIVECSCNNSIVRISLQQNIQSLTKQLQQAHVELNSSLLQIRKYKVSQTYIKNQLSKYQQLYKQSQKQKNMILIDIQRRIKHNVDEQSKYKINSGKNINSEQRKQKNILFEGQKCQQQEKTIQYDQLLIKLKQQNQSLNQKLLQLRQKVQLYESNTNNQNNLMVLSSPQQHHNININTNTNTNSDNITNPSQIITYQDVSIRNKQLQSQITLAMFQRECLQKQLYSVHQKILQLQKQSLKSIQLLKIQLVTKYQQELTNIHSENNHLYQINKQLSQKCLTLRKELQEVEQQLHELHQVLEQTILINQQNVYKTRLQHEEYNKHRQQKYTLALQNTKQIIQKQYLEKHTQLIKSSANELSLTKNQLNKLMISIHSKQQTIHQLQQTLSLKTRQQQQSINQQNKLLQNKQTRIHSLQTIIQNTQHKYQHSINDIKLQLQEYLQQLTYKNTMIQELQKQLQHSRIYNRQVQQQQPQQYNNKQQSKYQQQQIHRLKQQLIRICQQKDILIGRLQQGLIQKQRQIKKLQAQLQQRKQLNESHDTYIKQLQHQVLQKQQSQYNIKYEFILEKQVYTKLIECLIRSMNNLVINVNVNTKANTKETIEQNDNPIKIKQDHSKTVDINRSLQLQLQLDTLLSRQLQNINHNHNKLDIQNLIMNVQYSFKQLYQSNYSLVRLIKQMQIQILLVKKQNMQLKNQIINYDHKLIKNKNNLVQNINKSTQQQLKIEHQPYSHDNIHNQVYDYQASIKNSTNKLKNICQQQLSIIDKYKHTISILKTIIKQQTSKLKHSQQEIKRLKQQLHEVEIQNDRMNFEIKSKQYTIEQLQQSYTTKRKLQQKINELERQLTKSQEQIETLRGQNQTLLQKSRSINKQTRTRASQLNKSGHNHSNLQQQQYFRRSTVVNSNKSFIKNNNQNMSSIIENSSFNNSCLISINNQVTTNSHIKQVINNNNTNIIPKEDINICLLTTSLASNPNHFQQANDIQQLQHRLLMTKQNQQKLKRQLTQSNTKCHQLQAKLNSVMKNRNQQQLYNKRNQEIGNRRDINYRKY